EIVLSRAAPPHELVGPGRAIRALSIAGSSWGQREALRAVLRQPIYLSQLLAPAPPPQGFVTLTLERGFLAAEYRKQYVANVLQYARSGSGTPTILNEPYTPTVQSISLSYKASSEAVPVSSSSLADFANPDIQFFQVGPFGPLREHGYQRSQLAFVSGSDVRLLPQLSGAGELLIGLAPLAARDGVSLLFQVAPGSADPDLPHERLSWWALCDNHWKRLGADELVLDTTNDLLASGIVKLVLPDEATTVNTVLPAGAVWLKAVVAGDPAAVCQLLDVRANALEVRFQDQGNDPDHLLQPLPAGKIAKVRQGLAPVKSVTQPYASFGGQAAEDATSFRTRTAERLRHKDRCISPWDYERSVLEAFPEVHRVKCVPHARDGEWNAPGHVLLVVVPDLRNRNAVDPLQPRVDADTLSRIQQHAAERAGMQVQVAVKNPRFQKVRLDFKVKFRTGYDFNHYRAEVEQALMRTLSPWAFDAVREPGFGSAVYRSVLLDVVENLPYVDFVSDFRMYSFAGAVDTTDLEVARPATPDTLLVSDSAHTIGEAS
ncbi:MAG TPA: baseplate J/gp47 family protein, partial [Longimicrobiales bacterium]